MEFPCTVEWALTLQPKCRHNSRSRGLIIRTDSRVACVGPACRSNFGRRHRRGQARGHLDRPGHGLHRRARRRGAARPGRPARVRPERRRLDPPAPRPRSPDRQVPRAPGPAVPPVIVLSPTPNAFKEGHRGRAGVSSSNAPRFDVNPGTGESPGTRRRLSSDDSTAPHDAERPSRTVPDQTARSRSSSPHPGSLSSTPRRGVLTAYQGRSLARRFAAMTDPPATTSVPSAGLTSSPSPSAPASHGPTGCAAKSWGRAIPYIANLAHLSTERRRSEPRPNRGSPL